jgi:hypothetical protein
VSAFQRFAVAGFAAGVLLAATLGPPLWVIAMLAAAGVVTGFAVVLGTRLVTGREALVYQHHEIAVLAVSAGVLWLAGRPVLADLDAVALGLGVMLAAGRLGCLSAGCCHGRPAAIGIRYESTHLDGSFPPHLAGVRLFPVQALEAGLILVIVAIGGVMVDAGAAAGTALAWYVTASAAERFVLELLRGDTQRRRWRGVTEPQWLALVLTACVAAAGAGWGHTVTAGLLAVATVVLALRNGARIDDRDISALARCVHTASSGGVELVALPCGAIVSAGRTGASRHLTMSRADGAPVDPRQARRIARLTAHLVGAPSRTEARPGAGATRHVILDLT